MVTFECYSARDEDDSCLAGIEYLPLYMQLLKYFWEEFHGINRSHSFGRSRLVGIQRATRSNRSEHRFKQVDDMCIRTARKWTCQPHHH